MQDFSTAAEGGEATHFGFETVPLTQKQGRVDDVFHSVARRYDLMNDLMSAGLHREWKAALIAQLRPPRHRPFHLLDVAGGTGDIAFRAARAGGERTRVTVVDINHEMLAVGADRAEQRRLSGQVSFVQGNAEALPCPDGAFDAYTIAFGIRNVPRIERALAEAYRVLKRGGRFLCLEFAPVQTPLLDKIYDAYSFALIPRIGEQVTGDRAAYQYLVESIRQFPAPEAFALKIGAAGFGQITHRAYTGGIAVLHSAWKL